MESEFTRQKKPICPFVNQVNQLANKMEGEKS